VLLAGALPVPYAMYQTEAEYRLPAVWHAALFALLGGAITATRDGLSASSRGYRTRSLLLYSAASGLHGAWYAVLHLSDTG
jgi:hypothetical protein